MRLFLAIFPLGWLPCSGAPLVQNPHASTVISPDVADVPAPSCQHLQPQAGLSYYLQHTFDGTSWNQAPPDPAIESVIGSYDQVARTFQWTITWVPSHRLSTTRVQGAGGLTELGDELSTAVVMDIDDQGGTTQYTVEVQRMGCEQLTDVLRPDGSITWLDGTFRHGSFDYARQQHTTTWPFGAMDMIAQGQARPDGTWTELAAVAQPLASWRRWTHFERREGLADGSVQIDFDNAHATLPWTREGICVETMDGSRSCEINFTHPVGQGDVDLAWQPSGWGQGTLEGWLINTNTGNAEFTTCDISLEPTSCRMACSQGAPPPCELFLAEGP